MEVVKLKGDEQVILETITQRAWNIALSPDYNSEFVGSFYKRELLAYALLVYSAERPKEVCMAFECVNSRDNRSEISQEFMKGLKEYLSNERIEYIYAKRVEKWDQAMEYEKYMVDQGFIPVNITGKLLQYNVKNLVESGAVEIVNRNLSKFGDIRSYKEVEGSIINNFKANEKKNFFSFSKVEAANEFSRFLIKDSEIVAAVLADDVDYKGVFIAGIFTGRNGELVANFVPMLVSVINGIIEARGEDTELSLYVENEAIYHGLIKVFSLPEEEQLVMEHILPVKGSVK